VSACRDSLFVADLGCYFRQGVGQRKPPTTQGMSTPKRTLFSSQRVRAL
jgi:hypothetical protein